MMNVCHLYDAEAFAKTAYSSLLYIKEKLICGYSRLEQSSVLIWTDAPYCIQIVKELVLAHFISNVNNKVLNILLIRCLR